MKTRLTASCAVSVLLLLAPFNGGLAHAGHGLPHAAVKVWNITPEIGFNPDESVEDIAGVTGHVATAANPQTIAATIENTTHFEGPCGLIFWNPATNAFKWYGIGGGFSAGIDLNRSGPTFTGPDGGVFGAPTFQPGDVWVGINGDPPLYVNFKGSNNFRFYSVSGVNGVQVDQATGKVYFTDVFAGTINRLDPATNIVTTWAIGGSPHYLAIDGGGRVYSAVAMASVAGGVDAIVRIDPAAAVSNVTSWPIPGGGLTPGLPFETPDGVAFDTAGNLWFTESTSNQVGRLNPSTGEICEFTKTGLLNPQLIASTGSGTELQTFFTEGAGNAVGIITAATATPITSPCPVVSGTVSTVSPTTSTALFSDSIRTPLTATITPSEVDVPGVNGPGGILRFPMPTPSGGNPGAPNFPSGMTGVVVPNTVFGSYLDVNFAGNSAVFQLTSPAIVAPPPPPSGVVDLAVETVEAVQVVGGMPLVAGKPMMIRLRASLTGLSDLTPVRVTASVDFDSREVTGFVVNFEGKTYVLPNDGLLDIFLRRASEGDERGIRIMVFKFGIDGFNFDFPEAPLIAPAEGELSIVGHLMLSEAGVDSDISNNALGAAFVIRQQQQPLRVLFQRARSPLTNFVTSEEEFRSLVERQFSVLLALYPLNPSLVTLEISNDVALTGGRIPILGFPFGSVLIGVLRGLTGRCDRTFWKCVFVVPEDLIGGNEGLSAPRVSSRAVLISERAGAETTAHEIAHTLLADDHSCTVAGDGWDVTGALPTTGRPKISTEPDEPFSELNHYSFLCQFQEAGVPNNPWITEAMYSALLEQLTQ